MSNEKEWRNSKRYMGALGALYGDISSEEMSKVVARTKSPKSPRRALEWHEQAALVKWARLKGLLLISIPNSAKRSLQGHHREYQMGLEAGACDLFLCKPMGKYGGYFIEMKAPGAKPRENQLNFMEKVRRLGYFCNWFDSWEKAKNSIEEYLSNG